MSVEDFEVKVREWGHEEGIEYRKSFHDKNNQYYMNCLHYGEYKSNSKTITNASTLKKGCKSSIYARRVERDGEESLIVIQSVCSDHNHKKYSSQELLQLMKFKDLPEEIKK